MNPFVKKLRIAVGMSGGIDSTFAAWYLKKQGHHVEGFTLLLTSEDSDNPKNCCSVTALARAKNICILLGIPHTILTVTDVFEATVIRDFQEKYAAGKTPNPCILCNRRIKFGYLLDRVKALGFDRLATGHYAVKKFNPFTRLWSLYKNKDEKKDQSYFLSTLTQDQLASSFFPMAKFTKDQVRNLLKKEKIIIESPRESQDICFLGKEEDYRPFLRSRLPSEAIQPGNFVDSAGKILGQHNGIPFYTVGQRKGLNISFSEPLYVMSLDPVSNTVILGTREELSQPGFMIKNLNFSCKSGKSGLLSVKMRYQSKPKKCRISFLKNNTALVRFVGTLGEVTPGQQAVFYKNNRLVGSGEIEKT
jgi:tRNA-uridine 2-sulfurtransferase